jgi:hypothetical protein
MDDRVSPPVGAAPDSPVRLASRGRRVALASILALTVAYAVLAFGVLEPDATYSVDATIKYIQARTLLVNHFTQSGIPNRGSFIDPDGRFFPLSPPRSWPACCWAWRPRSETSRSSSHPGS